jgi:hypothetical protein
MLFRLPSSTKLEDLQDIANLFTYKEISRKSKNHAKRCGSFGKKNKVGRWAKTKSK